MKLSKDNWQEIIIGDIADEVNEKVLDPSKSGRDKFIRPEDLEIGDMYVKSYRNPDVAESGKFCNNGDILFARRSVSVSQFKRRSCVIKFDALCSDEITVIRERKETIHPEFLNYILNTTKLWDYAISRSVGSVSKRVKWEDLSNYTFLLPSTEEQKNINKLLQTIEQSIVHAVGQEQNLKLLRKSFSNALTINLPIFGNLLSEENCKPCSFSNLVECVEEHNKSPLENGLTRFVGLENIETENFTLQGFGNITDGTTFTKQFAKGDVLFGKRRAYLKKVAVADYDGICSSDILVFRAIEKEIMPELLPYYVSSDAFMNLAISTSAGSLSPRTKWRDLAGFQLSIPDMKAQEKIAEVLNQLSQSLQLIGQQIETLKKLKQKLLNEILS